MTDLRAIITCTRLAQTENEHVRKFTQEEASDIYVVYGCEDKCMQSSDGTFIRSGISSLVSRRV